MHLSAFYCILAHAANPGPALSGLKAPFEQIVI